jgi:multimeric flavodoxin WrbA
MYKGEIADMEKNLLFLLGSPRKNGRTEALADALAEGAKEKGYIPEKVRLSTLNLKGCLGCKQCWKKEKPCIQDDDMDNIYPLLEKADVLVFVSPVYFYSWSSQIKPVWDRLFPYIPSNGHTIKKKTILLTAGDESLSCFEGITTSYLSITQYMGWSDLGRILAPGVYDKTDIKNNNFLEKAKILGRTLP